MVRGRNFEAHCSWRQRSSTYLFRLEKFALILQDMRYTISEPYLVFWNVVQGIEQKFVIAVYIHLVWYSNSIPILKTFIMYPILLPLESHTSIEVVSQRCVLSAKIESDVRNELWQMNVYQSSVLPASLNAQILFWFIKWIELFMDFDSFWCFFLQFC